MPMSTAYFARSGVLVAEYLDADESDDGGDLVAVGPQLGEVGEARFESGRTPRRRSPLRSIGAECRMCERRRRGLETRENKRAGAPVTAHRQGRGGRGRALSFCPQWAYRRRQRRRIGGSRRMPSRWRGAFGREECGRRSRSYRRASWLPAGSIGKPARDR